MPRRLAGWLTSLFLALLCADALAQTQIWRCGPDGRSFSDRPCADGRLQTLAPAPDAERVQQARTVAEREAALAQALRSERLAQEAARRAQQQAEERERRLAQREAARQEARARAQSRRDKRAHRHREAGDAGGVTLSPSRQTRQALSAAPAPRAQPAGAGTSAAVAHASR